jgi:hypothetical protein
MMMSEPEQSPPTVMPMTFLFDRPAWQKARDAEKALNAEMALKAAKKAAIDKAEEEKLLAELLGRHGPPKGQ